MIRRAWHDGSWLALLCACGVVAMVMAVGWSRGAAVYVAAW